MDSSINIQPTHKKRKLKRPRVNRACAFCRRRKIRCTGETPQCAACKEEEIECQFEDRHVATESPTSGRARGTIELRHDNEVATESPTSGRERRMLEPPENSHHLVNGPNGPDPISSSRTSRRNSMETAATFDHGIHVGSHSGVSFLYRWQGKDTTTSPQNTEHEHPIPLISYGDPQPVATTKQPYMDHIDGKRLIDHYFRFATPTYRFLHQQTLEGWMRRLIDSKNLPPAKAASVLLVWSQALLYTTDEISELSQQNPGCGESYYEQAKRMLENEPGPATLVSVQVRVAICLYLLSTSRVNECRFIFGFTTTLVTALGLHRRFAAKRLDLDAIEAECCKRTFWCVYILDSYLSVILGRPRSFREIDLDQDFPTNIDDSILCPKTDLTLVPHHGNLEASIFHARLALVMAHNNDVLYTLTTLSEQDIVKQSEESLQSLQRLESELPSFLKPRDVILTGFTTWERQNTVLKLALAHAQILATRRCIMVDLGSTSTLMDRLTESRSLCIQACMASICTIIDVTYEMMHRKRLYESFWFTQYIALCAISTLFMLQIQCSRRWRLGKDVERFNIEVYFDKAEKLQQYLSSITPSGSQAQRHHDLLNHLRVRAHHKRGEPVRPTQVHSVLDNDREQEITERSSTLDNHQASELTVSKAQAQVIPVIGWDTRGGVETHINPDLEPLATFTPSPAEFGFAQDTIPWQYLDQLGPWGGESIGWFDQQS